VNLIIALGVVWCMVMIVRGEKARDGADDYQMSDAWLAQLHVGPKALSRRVWKRRAGFWPFIR
jgi:hypothetical protein